MIRSVKQAPWRGGSLVGRIDQAGEPPQWRDNAPFAAVLRLDRYEMPAARVVWTAEDGGELPMFLTDFVALARGAEIVRGEARGVFVVVKRGAAYGIARVANL